VENNNNLPWERKGILPYMLACTVKSRLSRTSLLMTKREEGGEKGACSLPKLGCLYLCRLCTMFVSLSRLRVGIHPTAIVSLRRRISKTADYVNERLKEAQRIRKCAHTATDEKPSVLEVRRYILGHDQVFESFYKLNYPC
jgi:glucosamine 6-phosphate synthetase-like amidotransferase/phosphosugar isomerase protein